MTNREYYKNIAKEKIIVYYKVEPNSKSTNPKNKPAIYKGEITNINTNKVLYETEIKDTKEDVIELFNEWYEKEI